MTEKQARNILHVWHHWGYLKSNMYEGHSDFSELVHDLMTHGKDLEI